MLAVNFLVLMGLAFAAEAPLDRALKLYGTTDYDGALRLLAPLHSRTPAVLALTGKCYYMTGEYRKAADVLEAAVAAEPADAELRLWLGRALGRRAETANWFSAPGLAKRARTQFEKAVALDPSNQEALDDLLDYYLHAPGFLGGGEDKARALVERFKDVDLAEYHVAQARIAEHRKQYKVAEYQLKRAIDLGPAQAGRLVHLARLLNKLGRYNESDQYFRKAQEAAPRNPQVLYDRASAYVEAGRSLDQARELLRQYLNCPLTPDNSSRADAEKLLQKAGGG
jgi:tetratricopeptide (TPR) repeat protein